MGEEDDRNIDLAFLAAVPWCCSAVVLLCFRAVVVLWSSGKLKECAEAAWASSASLRGNRRPRIADAALPIAEFSASTPLSHHRRAAAPPMAGASQCRKNCELLGTIVGQ